MPFRARFLAVAVACAVLGAFAPPPVRAADQTPYDMHVILGLTGQAAFIGKVDQDTLRLLEADVNRHGGIKGQPLKFVFHDDQTNPQVSLQIANGLIAQKVPIILGPTITGTCNALVPLVANGPVLYCLSPGLHPAKGSYTYSVSTSTTDAIGVDLRYMKAKGWKRIATLDTTDATGQEADRAFSSYLSSPEFRDMTNVAPEHFAVSDISAAAQVARIKAANPQVLYINATGTPAGTALRAVNDAGLDIPVFLVNSNMVTAQMKQYAAFLPKALYSMGPGYVAGMARSPASRRAVDEYLSLIKAAGLPNDYITGISWDAALIVVDALRSIGTGATAQQLQNYLQHLKGYGGIGGVYDFTDGSGRGLSQDDIMVMRYVPATASWESVSKFGGAPTR